MSEISVWKPFLDAPWSTDQREAFDHISDWASAIADLKVSEENDAKLHQIFADEAALISEKKRGNVLPVDLCDKTFLLVDKLNLSLDWFALQVKGGYHFQRPIQFATGTEMKAFLHETVVPKAYLIASLADVAHRWQLPKVADLASAYFLVNQLVNMKDNLAQNRLFIPESDLVQAGVTVEDLRNGTNSKAMEKMLWKQVIRIRDAFAQGQPLVKEVPRKFRRTFKRNWLTGLELVLEIERRDYDLWSSPIHLSRLQQFQIAVLTFVGKGAAKARGR